MTLPRNDGVLYSFRRCPYAIRARMALLSAGLDPEVREVVLRDKPPEMLALSPKGTVPVWQLADGRVLEESLDIMDHALLVRDPEHWLRHRAPVGDEASTDREVLRELLLTNDGAFKRALDRIKYPERHPELDVNESRSIAATQLAALDRRLLAAPHLDGESPGFYDAAIFPFVRQLAGADEGFFAGGPWPHLRRWHASMLVNPRFTRVMNKLAPWRAGAPAVHLQAACSA